MRGSLSFSSISAHGTVLHDCVAEGLRLILGGFYHDTGEGGISPYYLKHRGDLVWEIGSGFWRRALVRLSRSLSHHLTT